MMVPPMPNDCGHMFPVTVHWEDTDAAGIVYYANYLRFIERARSDLVASAGIDQRVLWEQDGVMFPVRRAEVDYLQPARLGDRLQILTEIEQLKKASMALRQQVLRDDDLLVSARIQLACVGQNGRPRRLPSDVHALLETRLLEAHILEARTGEKPVVREVSNINA